MNRRSLLISVVLALGMGLAAGALVMNQSKKSSKVIEKEKTVKVVVVSRSLTRGVKLTKKDLVLKNWPERLASPQFVRNLDAAVDRVLVANVVKGEPLVTEKLAPEDSVEGLSTLIPRGRRAFSVRVDDVTGVGGYLLPGSRVDVLTTITVEVKSKKKDRKSRPRKISVTKTILQDVEVLAAGEKSEAGGSKKQIRTPVVTLLLTPEQGEILTLAASKGSIWLSMRNPRDKERTDSGVISVSDLLGAQEEEPEPKKKDKPPKPAPRRIAKKRPPPVTVEIIHGAKRSTVSF